MGGIASDALSDVWDDVFSRQDLVDVQRAVRGSWSLSEAKRLAIVERLLATFDAAENWPRLSIAAARAAIEMSAANMRADHRLLESLLNGKGHS